MASSPVTTAKGRYDQLTAGRLQFLQRARECAEYTIPTLVPPEGATSSHRYPTPYQSLGARGVNNLASKLLLALFPPNSPFFRLAIDDFTLEKLAKKEGARAEIEEALNSIERAVMTELETTPTRAPVFEGLKHLLVAGNALIYMLPEGGFKVFGIERYVCKRDPSGNLLEAITREVVSPLEIPEKHRAALLGDQKDDGRDATEDTVEVYTHIKRTDAGWTIYQEVNGKQVPGSTGTYPLDKSPWLALRFISVSGEDYGRGFVEEHLGDLISLEGLSRSIVQAAAVAAKILFLVRPNAITSATDLSKKESGDFAVGNAEDVTVLSLDKYNDFRVALEMRSQLSESLSFSFMLNTAVQRKGERVTAEEIRFMANELETGLGGVYSTQSQEFQLPVVAVTMHRMEKKGRLPALPKGIVKPMISTGIEAIGRGNDLTKLGQLLQAIAPLGEQTIALHMNVSDYIKRTATALGIDQKGLVNSAEEIAATQAQQQMQSMVQQLGPNAITQAGGMIRDQMAPGNQPTAGA